MNGQLADDVMTFIARATTLDKARDPAAAVGKAAGYTAAVEKPVMEAVIRTLCDHIEHVDVMLHALNGTLDPETGRPVPSWAYQVAGKG